jgi:hypothetical protein
MNITINSKVSCSDGPCARTRRVVLKPTTEQITHIVVSDELYPETEYLIPVELISTSTPESIELNCSKEEMSAMPVFDQIQFIPSNLNGYVGGPYVMWPYYIPQAAPMRLEKEHIPLDELTIRRTADVEATDGHIGHVDGFLVNPQNDHITHLLLREGHLWGKKDVAIPVSEIDHYQDNGVFLKMSKQEIEALPPVPLRSGPGEGERP